MTTSIDLHVPVELFATGWQKALVRPPRVVTRSTSLAANRPQVIAVEVRSRRIAVNSFGFPEQTMQNWGRIQPALATKVRPSPRSRIPATRPSTRLQPPRDIVKLEDRLYYLLQPPLEALIQSNALDFPFQPFPYQYEGVAFLYPRFAAILADEMGLGKTMQAITAVRLLLHAGQIRRVLFICPKPLVSNWHREFAQWAPEIPVITIGGNKARRQWQWREVQVPVKIANYEILLRDDQDLTATHYDLVVLDEAQRIKNASATTSRIVHSIPRSRAWALTGTPVENSSDDLVGIFEFLSPGYLHRGMKARAMGRAVADHILRRTKQMVLTDLPPMMYRDAELSLTPPQWDSYKRAEEEGIVHLTDLGESVTIQHVFELILRLKQICNFDPVTGASAKFERLRADLEEVAASGQKAIVFSQWVRTLQELSRRLEGWCPLEFHGGIRPAARDQQLERFRGDPKHRVLLISYGAGSVGLNLQFCRYVFLFDRWWNPAVEDQAVNRAHRIGVDGPVTVTRMLTPETIEQRVDQILREKRALLATIFSAADSPRRLSLSQQELFGLFQLRVPGAARKTA